MKILICGREAEIDERTSSDNCDLDLEIAEILGDYITLKENTPRVSFK